jgi:hypothetical protein
MNENSERKGKSLKSKENQKLEEKPLTRYERAEDLRAREVKTAEDKVRDDIESQVSKEQNHQPLNKQILQEGEIDKSSILQTDRDNIKKAQQGMKEQTKKSTRESERKAEEGRTTSPNSNPGPGLG